MHVLSCLVQLKSVLLISCVFWFFFFFSSSEHWQTTLFQIFFFFFLLVFFDWRLANRLHRLFKESVHDVIACCQAFIHKEHRVSFVIIKLNHHMRPESPGETVVGLSGISERESHGWDSCRPELYFRARVTRVQAAAAKLMILSGTKVNLAMLISALRSFWGISWTSELNPPPPFFF